MKCTNCGTENPDGQKFCGNCGRDLHEPLHARLGVVKCPNCGSDNQQGRRFCANCGSMIPRTPRAGPSTEEEEKGPNLG